VLGNLVQNGDLLHIFNLEHGRIYFLVPKSQVKLLITHNALRLVQRATAQSKKKKTGFFREIGCS
jgi:hypothetical protein